MKMSSSFTRDYSKSANFMLEVAKQSLSHRCPRSPDELWYYVALFFGIKLSRNPVWPGSDAPFTFLAEAFFYDFPEVLEKHKLRRVRNALVIGSRKSGKTTLLAILHFLNSRFKAGCSTCHLGAIHIQGKRAYEYFKDFVSRDTNSQLISHSVQSYTLFKNKSRVEILSGTEKSVAGPTAQKLSVDEFDLWDLKTLETSFQILSPKEGVSSQIWLVSTRYSPFGLVNKFLERASARGFTVYRWNEFDVAEPCEACEGEDCPLYAWNNPFSGEFELLCGGRLLRSDGHRPKDDVIAQYLSSDPRTWATQRLLLAPSLGNLVYPEFDKAVHVKPPPLLVSDWQIEAGVDWGYQNPACILVVARSPQGAYFVVDEWYEKKRVPGEIKSVAQGLARKWNIRCFHCGADEPGQIADWTRSGLNAKKSSSKVEVGITKIRSLLKDARGRACLFVSPVCKNLIREFSLYHYENNKIVKENDHALDALRYCLTGFFKRTPAPLEAGLTQVSKWRR